MRDEEPGWRRGRFPLYGQSAMEGARPGTSNRGVWLAVVLGVVLVLSAAPLIRVVGAVVLGLCAVVLLGERHRTARARALSRRVREREGR